MLDDLKKCSGLLNKKGFKAEAKLLKQLTKRKMVVYAITIVEGGYDEHFGLDPEVSQLFRTKEEAEAAFKEQGLDAHQYAVKEFELPVKG